MFIFAIILAKGIIEKNDGKRFILKEEPASKLPSYLEYTYRNVYQKMMKNKSILGLNSLKKDNFLKLMHLFNKWINIKKYSKNSILF